jgi:acetoacetyl-CoA synthetase
VAVSVGELMWTPPADARETAQIGRFMTWVERERGLALRDYDALFAW